MAAELVLDALKWRYATKAFDPIKKIPAETWQLLEDSLHLAPSSFGLQPWKFIIVENAGIREQLKPVSWGQSQVTDASHFVVMASRKTITNEYVDKYMNRIAEVRGVSLESLEAYKTGIKNNLITGPRAKTVGFWAERQTYIAMGFLMSTAALVGVDACPMEGIDPPEYDKILKLTDTDYATVAAVALGYRSETDKYAHAKKVRFKKEDVIVKA